MSTTYPNGRIPGTRLVWFWALNEHGKRERFRATERFVQQWRSLEADVLANEGVQLTITSGPNVYRDFAQQVDMRAEHGLGAAFPGRSSHGGTFEGRDSLAVDVNNWAVLGKAKFYAYARKHGFTPGLISRKRGYARDEPWHIVLFDPFAPAKTTKPTPAPIGDTMATQPNLMHVTTDKKYKYRIAITNPGSGFALVYVTNDAGTNNMLAKQYKTGSARRVSTSLFDAIVRSTRAMLPVESLEVEVIEA